MSLFSSIQMASNTLSAMQIGLHVVGQNIANANTPGYIRENVLYTPAPVQRLGDLTLGLGVQIDGIVQQVDQFMQDRLLGASSDRAGATVEEETYQQLEAILGELSDTDISTSLTNFFASLAEVLNQPESVAVRHLAILQGQTLAGDINHLTERIRDLRSDVNLRTIALVEEINTLTEEVANLNVRIAETEGGGSLGSDAGALRDQRQIALGRLAEIFDIEVNEQLSGSVNVSVGGEFLVFENIHNNVEVDLSSDRGLSVATIQFTRSQSPLMVGGGELGGLYKARDAILGNFLDQLDTFAGTLVFEFNKVYSQGQGLTGFDQVTAEHAVDDITEALDAAGLDFTPVNGAFDLLVLNHRTGLTKTHTIHVDLNGLDGDMSLSDLAAAISAVDGVTATISSTNELSIVADSGDSEFAFAGDTSGLLAALGINTFFSGTAAGELNVNQALIDDASKFAASKNGIGEDTENGVDLVAFIDKPLGTMGGTSISLMYDELINETTQGSSIANSIAEGFRIFEATLDGNAQAVSGVSLDEEAIEMITLQRIYQASARFIKTVAELLDILVNL
ncbi:MAG: flagellar hook-associated protein FlgK [Pirellulales bacterium]|nr:flagellar hook-associated protein FlgK [Pirellulales bacterium]